MRSHLTPSAITPDALATALPAKPVASAKLNNIAELRLFFALCVVVAHTIQLAGFTQYDILRKILSSEVAVQAFFILSGFLVMGSYARSPGVADFYYRRLLRIYPGYAVAVLFFLALCLLQAQIQGHAVVRAEILRYLWANLSLLNFFQPTLGGVFESSAYREINGALWTIKLEVMFYALVPLLHACAQRWSLRHTAVMLMVVGLGWRPLLDLLQHQLGLSMHPSLAHQLPGQLHFFALGILLFDVSRQPGRASGNALVALAGVALAFGMGQWGMGQPRLALQMLLLLVFIHLVTRLPQARTPLGKTDLSYGVYLSHFPIVQLLVGTVVWQWGAEAFLLLVLALASAYALLSWRYIEQPALRLAPVGRP